jgi:hypothetical protein
MKGVKNPHDEIKGSISTPKGTVSAKSSVALLTSLSKNVSTSLKKVLIVPRSNGKSP